MMDLPEDSNFMSDRINESAAEDDGENMDLELDDDYLLSQNDRPPVVIAGTDVSRLTLLIRVTALIRFLCRIWHRIRSFR